MNDFGVKPQIFHYKNDETKQKKEQTPQILTSKAKNHNEWGVVIV